MWSSFRRLLTYGVTASSGIPLAVVGIFLGASASAAEWYVQPIASLSEEFDSNLDLDYTGRTTNVGYALNAATIIGIATPVTDTNVEPQLHYVSYPNATALDHLEGTLDFNTTYTGQRSTFSAFGRFDHLNDIEAELPTAEYNAINPQSPTAPQTGEVNVGVTRNNTYLVPKYQFDITPLVSIGASATVEDLTYSVTNPYALVDFNYEEGEVFVNRDFGPRVNVTLGGYGTHYAATNIDSNAQSKGGAADFEYKWSALARIELSAQYGHTTMDTLQPVMFRGAANTLSATLSGTWRRQAGVYRLDVGRTVTPSGGGGLYVDEQLQTEYDRFITPRLTVIGALLYVRSRGLSADIAGLDENYGQALVSLKWMMARTWFVLGGASYTNRRYLTDPSGAYNERAYVQFGYQGLGRQQ